MDSRLAGIREVAILDVGNIVGIVRHFLINFCICLFTGLLFIIQLFTIDGIRAAIAQSTTLDVGDGRTAVTAQRDCCLIGVFIILNCIVTEVLHVIGNILNGFAVFLDGISIVLDLCIEGT